MTTIIKSTTHSIKFANIGKQHNLFSFLTDYNNAVWFYVDYLWHNPIHWTLSSKNTNTTSDIHKVFDLSKNKYDLPKFISTTTIEYKTDLSARALKICLR